MVFGQQKLAERREALKRLCLLPLVVLTTGLFFVRAALAAKQQTFVYPQLIEETVQRLKQSHGLQCIYRNIDPALKNSGLIFTEAEIADYQRLYEYVHIFDEEIQKYPADFFKNDYVKEVYFVKKLFHQENDAEGLYDYRKKVVFFDFATQRGGSQVARHNIHHEIFHILDTNTFSWKDEDWEDLNDPDFKYIKTGKVFIDREKKNEVNYFAPQRKGFVTYYAMTSAYEDRAEVYACLFIKSQSRLIHQWAKKDPILAKKIEYIMRFLQNYSKGQIDQRYFTSLWSRFKQ